MLFNNPNDNLFNDDILKIYTNMYNYICITIHIGLIISRSIIKPFYKCTDRRKND